MTTSQVSVADVLFNQAVPTEHSFRNTIIGLISLQRIAILIMILPIVIAPMALAGGRFDDPRFPFLLIMWWFVWAASNVLNDISDAERDKRKWPQRPLPNGLISKSTAALYAIILAGIGLAIAGFVFSWLYAALVLILLVWGDIYARYTRDKIGHFTVIVPLGLVPIVVWSAFSPETVFSALPWLFFTFCLFQTMMGQFLNEAFDPEVKALPVRSKPATERLLYVTSVIGMFFMGTIIFFYIKVSWLYLVVLTAYIVWALYQARYLGEHVSQQELQNAFRISTIWVVINFLCLAAFVWIK